jgi:hypothetical protein
MSANDPERTFSVEDDQMPIAARIAGGSRSPISLLRQTGGVLRGYRFGPARLIILV